MAREITDDMEPWNNRQECWTEKEDALYGQHANVTHLFICWRCYCLKIINGNGKWKEWNVAVSCKVIMNCVCV